MGIIVSLCDPGNSAHETIDEARPTIPTQPETKTIPNCRAQDGDQNCRQQFDLAVESKEAGKKKNRLTRKWQARVLQHHPKKDDPVPVASIEFRQDLEN